MTLDKDWVKIFSAPSLYKAELIKGLLMENGIGAVVLNKQDSAYLFGEAEVYVQANDVIKAMHLLNEHEGR